MTIMVGSIAIKDKTVIIVFLSTRHRNRSELSDHPAFKTTL